MRWRRKSKGTKQYRAAEAAAVEEMRKMWNEPQPVPKLEPRWGQSSLVQQHVNCGRKVGETGGKREW